MLNPLRSEDEAFKALLWVAAVIVVVVVLVVAGRAVAAPPAANVALYRAGGATSTLQQITAGPDGNMWFVDGYGDRAGRITPTGAISYFPTPTHYSYPTSIVSGPGGDLWLVESTTSKIARLTTAGQMTEYAIPTTGRAPGSLATGPDGTLWFTSLVPAIDHMTADGRITPYPIPGHTNPLKSSPGGITAGPDGSMWFTETLADDVGAITPSGAVTRYPLPSKSGPLGLAAGSDGALWVAESFSGRIARVTTAGAVTEYRVPGDQSQSRAVTEGPDGAMWFTSSRAGCDAIGRIATDGTISQYVTGTQLAGLNSVAFGPGGDIWFTALIDGNIGRMRVLVPGGDPHATDADRRAAVQGGATAIARALAHTSPRALAARGKFSVPATWPEAGELNYQLRLQSRGKTEVLFGDDVRCSAGVQWLGIGVPRDARRRLAAAPAGARLRLSGSFSPATSDGAVAIRSTARFGR